MSMWDSPELAAYTRRQLAQIASVRPEVAADLAHRYLTARTARAQQDLALEIERRMWEAEAEVRDAAWGRGR